MIIIVVVVRWIVWFFLWRVFLSCVFGRMLCSFILRHFLVLLLVWNFGCLVGRWRSRRLVFFEGTFRNRLVVRIVLEGILDGGSICPLLFVTFYKL